MALYPFKDFVTTLKDGVSKALRVSGYDEADEMLKVKSMQTKWRAGFSGTTLNADKWEIVQQGTGQVISVANGSLTITSGTTANAETIIRSKESFTIPMRIMAHIALSQRIANQEFYVELISSDNDPDIPNSDSRAGWQFDGTSATSNKYLVNGGDQPVLISSATTSSSTASTGSIFEVEPTADECWFFSRVPDNTAGRAYSFVRHSQIPNPNLKYKVQIRVKNLSTAPASSTTLTSQFINVSDYAELTAEITAGRGNAVQGQGIYATVGGTVTASSITGNVAHDSAISGNPVRVAGRALTANYTATASGDVADLTTTTVGALVVREHCIPEQSFSYACPSPIVNTTDVVLKTAGASGIRNYLNGFQFQNTNATATEIVIKDGTTVIWRGYAPANMTMMANITFDQPLRGSSAIALNFACITTGASVYVNAQGYQAP